MAKHRQFFQNRLKEWTVAGVLVALSGYSQAYALGIGELQVQSGLGQPLDAIVHILATPGESLRADCFRIMNPGDSALPPVTNVHLSLSSSPTGGAALRLRGREALREPMSELIVQVNCKGTPRITRTFLVMLDPPRNDDIRTTDTAAVAAAQPAPTAVTDITPATDWHAASAVAAIVSDSPRVRIRPAYVGPNEPIRPGSVYLVQLGDVLSMIASRVAGRGEYTVWPIAEHVLKTNPHAFENGDPNRLVVGAQVRIPPLEAAWLEDGTPGVSALAAIRGTITAESTAQRAELSIPAPDPPTPAPIKPSLASREVARPAGLGDYAEPLPSMVLSQRLSHLSQERLTIRRSGRIQVMPKAVVDPRPEPRQPQQPSVPAGNIAPASPETLPRSEPIFSQGFAGGILSWILLVVGIFIGVIATAMGLRSSTQRRVETEVAARLKADQYQERLEASRQNRETFAPEETIIVDEHTAPVPPAADDVPSRDAIDERLKELVAPAADSPIDIDLQTVIGDEEEEEFEFSLFDEPNALDLELLARDYAESVPDVKKLAELEAAGSMLSNDELGLVPPDATEIIQSGLDLELPEEKSGGSGALSLDVGEAVPGEHPSDNDPTTPTPQLPGNATMEIDAGLLRMTAVLSKTEAVARSAQDEPPTAPAKDPEEFYHLEASSIVPAGDLQFEGDQFDEESKILEFRKPVRTGTDDSTES